MSPTLPQTRPPFWHFFEWMIDAHDFEKTTARAYVSAMRAFLRDPATGQGLVADPVRFAIYAKDYDDSLKTASRGVFRSSLRMLIEYVRQTRGVQLYVEFTDHRRDDHRIQPHVLGPLLRELEKQKIPFSKLETIRWRDVEPSRMAGMGFIHDRLAHAVYRAPMETIRALNLWAGGGQPAEPDQPLVPYQPKGLRSMPTKRMVRIARGP